MKNTAVDQEEGGFSSNKSTVDTDGGSYVEGDVNTGGGDFVGHDKHVINNFISNLIQQASSATEELDKQNKLETLRLAQGVMAFVERLKKSASDGGHAGPVYKGLLEYGLGDAEMFFGRDEAGRKFIKIMERGRLTVIQAESGAGKSSFLQAKISPALLVAGYLPIYLRSYTSDPVVDIKCALLPHLNQNQTLKHASLRDFLLAVGGVLPQTRLYIFLDQFEELFTQFDEDIRAAFVRQLSECLEDTSLDVRWVLSLRTEFFGRLANYEPPLHPFHNQYLLDPLKREEAEAAIIEPARKNDVEFEPGLVDKILDDLGRNERAGNLIAPPQLQLVCSSLYDSLDGAKKITRERYDSLGGTTGILSSYLKKVIRNLPKDEREVAPKLLEALIDSNKQRVRRTKEELANDPGLSSAGPHNIDKTLRRLGDHRLLRIQEGEAPGTMTYELAHDYLVNDISIDEQVQTRKRVQELLDQRLREFQQHKILLGAEELGIINPYRNDLYLSGEAQKLIAASERQLKLRRRFTISFVGGAGLLVAAAVIFGIVALKARQTIRDADESMRLLFENNGIVPIGQSAHALAFDGNRIWVASSASSKLQAIDLGTGKIEQIVSLNFIPSLLFFDGKKLWMTDIGHRKILQSLDPDTGQVGKEIQLPEMPFGVISDGERIWTSYLWDKEIGGGYVRAINPKTGEIGQRIKVEEFPEALAFDGKRIWVASKNRGTIQSIDTTSDKVSDSIDVGMQPELIVYAKNRLWLASKDFATFKVFNPETGEILTPDPPEGDSLTGGTPLLALAFDGSRLWVTAKDNSLRSINPETYAVSEPVRVGASPVAIAFDGMRLWVANQSDMTVQAIEPAAAFIGEQQTLLNLPEQHGDASVSAMAASEEFLYVAQRNVIRPLSLSRDDYYPKEGYIVADLCASALIPVGNKLWFANSCKDYVQALDLESRRTSQPIMIGKQPGHMTFDGKRLWVANISSDSVQAVDVAGGVAYPAIPVSKHPMSLAFDGKRVWVITSAKLQSIDPEKGQIISSINHFGGSGGSGETLSIFGETSDMAFAAGRLWIVTQESEMRAVDPETLEVVARVGLGEGPKILAFDGNRLWVANREKNTLRAVDTKSLSVGIPVGIGTNPESMIFDGQRLWISYQNSNVVQPVTIK
jgi:DNA-binding beta-propeller fold protein YncE